MAATAMQTSSGQDLATMPLLSGGEHVHEEVSTRTSMSPDLCRRLLIPDDSATQIAVAPICLEPRETGQIKLPEWAYQQFLAQWVRQLQAWDDEDAALVKTHVGFTEHARRLLFAYEDKFEGKEPKLYTILPSGIIESRGKKLAPEKERGLIAYPYCQKIDKDAAADLKITPFVRECADGTLNVMQTWPTIYNEAWKKSFQPVAENPDPEHFKDEAVKEFKDTMLKLFELTELPEDTLFYGTNITENKHPVYIGKGISLIALLRRNSSVREGLQIIQLIEPNGFVSEYDDPETSKKRTKEFYVSLHGMYCLYTKIGYQVMAVVKPLEQFSHESKLRDDGQPIGDVIQNPLPPSPLLMDWSCEPACQLVGKSALVVWFCTGGMVGIRRIGSLIAKKLEYNFADECLNSNVLLLLAILVAVPYGVYVDKEAMKFCIVAWTQRVKRLSIPIPCFERCFGKVNYCTFRAFMLCSTAVQLITIQMNAWFLVTAWQQSAEVQRYWEYLWIHSWFWWVPCRVWKWASPGNVAVVLWLLSTFQFFIPMLLSTTWLCRFLKECACRGRREEGNDVENADKENSPHGVNVLEKVALRTPPIHKVACFFHPIRVTPSQELAMLAVSCGLRFTSSMSISYPVSIIQDIIKFKQGFTVRNPTGLEVMSQGWELHALRTFRALQMSIIQRMSYVLLLKLAGQMNLQISLFIIERAKNNKGQSFYHQLLAWTLRGSDVFQIVSILGLFVTMLSELIDAWLLLEAFLYLSKKVWLTVWKGKNRDHYAIEDTEECPRQTYTRWDVRMAFWVTIHNMIGMALLIIISVFLIGYAVLKFVMASTCSSDLWQFQDGCLDKINDFPCD